MVRSLEYDHRFIYRCVRRQRIGSGNMRPQHVGRSIDFERQMVCVEIAADTNNQRAKRILLHQVPNDIGAVFCEQAGNEHRVLR